MVQDLGFRVRLSVRFGGSRPHFSSPDGPGLQLLVAGGSIDAWPQKFAEYEDCKGH